MTQPPDGEGERVEHSRNDSPDVAFDADRVAAAARQQDPGLPPETASLLANQAWAALREIGELDAPALARSLMAANASVGATPCNAVATASVSFCESYGVSPA